MPLKHLFVHRAGSPRASFLYCPTDPPRFGSGATAIQGWVSEAVSMHMHRQRAIDTSVFHSFVHRASTAKLPCSIQGHSREQINSSGTVVWEKTMSHVPHYVALNMPSVSQATLLSSLLYFCREMCTLAPALCLSLFLPNGIAQGKGAGGRMWKSRFQLPSGDWRHKRSCTAVWVWIQSTLTLLKVFSRVCRDVSTPEIDSSSKSLDCPWEQC